jgi:hypothetical protein
MLEMARPFEHHRTPWFTELMTAAQAKLQTGHVHPTMKS